MYNNYSYTTKLYECNQLNFMAGGSTMASMAMTVAGLL